MLAVFGRFARREPDVPTAPCVPLDVEAFGVDVLRVEALGVGVLGEADCADGVVLGCSVVGCCVDDVIGCWVADCGVVVGCGCVMSFAERGMI